MPRVVWLSLAVVAACGAEAPAPLPAPAPTSTAAPVAPLATPGEPLVAPRAFDPGPAPADPAVKLVARDYTCAVLASGAVSCWAGGLASPTRMPWTNVAELSMGALTCVRYRDASAECGTLDGATFTRAFRIERDVDEIVAGERATCVLEHGTIACALGTGPLQKVPAIAHASDLYLYPIGAGYNEPLQDGGCASLSTGGTSCFTLDYKVAHDPTLPTAMSIHTLGAAASADAATHAYRPGLDDCSSDGDQVSCEISAPRIPMHRQTVTLRAPTQALSAGSHACAIFDGGRVACWGVNSSGGLGREWVMHNREPARGLADAVDLAGTDGRIFAVRANGQLVSWGAGGKDAGYVDVPHTMVGVDDATSVVATGSMGCVLRRGDRVSCWHVSDGKVHEIAAVSGATLLAADGAAVLARVGTHWKRIQSNVPPDIEDVPELDGATDAASGVFRCTRDSASSVLHCLSASYQAEITDVAQWVTMRGIEANDAAEYVAVKHTDGRAELYGLYRNDAVQLSRLSEMSPSAAEVFTSGLDLCVRETAGTVRCGRGATWSYREGPAGATKLMLDGATCGLMPDHHVLCTAGDPWLFGTGAATSDVPVRIAL